MSIDVKLRWVARMYYGDALSPDDRRDGEVPVMGSNGAFDSHDEANLEGPCIIVGRKGSHGKINWCGTEAWVTDTAFGIDQTMTDADLRWLYYALQTLRLDATSQDTGVPGLSREKAYEMRLDVPPLEVQRRVADMLDRETGRIDALIAKNKRVIAALEARDRRLLYDAVHGVSHGGSRVDSGLPWCLDLPAGWDAVPLYLIAEHDYGYPFPSDGFTDSATGIPVIRIRDVLPNRIETWFGGADSIPPECWVDDGDIVIGMDGLFNHVHWSGGRAALNQRVCTYRPRDPQRLSNEYLGLAIGFPLQHINDIVYSTTVKHLSFADLDGQKIPVPPLQTQNQIVVEVAASRAKSSTLRSKVERQIDLLELRRQSLITAAVTGQITV